MEIGGKSIFALSKDGGQWRIFLFDIGRQIRYTSFCSSLYYCFGDTRIYLELQLEYVINFPRSRGVSGALYLQSAIAGVISFRGFCFVRLPSISGVDVWVLRNRNLRTVSGWEHSSTK